MLAGDLLHFWNIPEHTVLRSKKLHALPGTGRNGKGQKQYAARLSYKARWGGIERFNFEKGEMRGGGAAPPGPK
ncbi:hypothetical protein [uncultured Desulfovibrio sp.]|uniref:hypothetical protein n=1 Tax=uncultured Desulfovibrio sp. TaxID=167968 RepID=UPI00260B5B9C|nr:hypothetical protein [uncultured Desulfovibrio sp.]